MPGASSAAEVAAALRRVREAGLALHERPVKEVHERLGAVLETWRDPESEPRRRLLADLPNAEGFTEQIVGEGLERGFEDWTAEALHALVRRELGDPRGQRQAWGFPSTSVVLAGSIPPPTLLSLLAPLILRSPVLAKASTHDPLTPQVVADSVAAVDADLGACIEVVHFPSSAQEPGAALLEADCVVATGSDDTIGRVAGRVRPPRRFVGYGHRVSVAALGPQPQENIYERLALDVALWDQLGCLSPVALYVISPDGRVPDTVTQGLCEALAMAEKRLPRGFVPTEAAAQITNERGAAEMRAASGDGASVHRGPGTSWTVAVEGNARWRTSPLYRFLRIHPVANPAELVEALRPVSPHLAAVGLEGFGVETAAVARALVGLGASRICRFGRFQSPPLDWCHDNQGVLLPLARLGDVESGCAPTRS